ncbi:MAG: hypothetical protein PUC26_06515 [Eubacteriales bacterium]|nr:hypothetical protein [Eubacteriales bacterium]
MNLQDMFRFKKAKNTFFSNHPKVPAFLGSVKEKGFCEGQEIAVAVRYPDGTEYKTGIRVRPEDLELLNMLKEV